MKLLSRSLPNDCEVVLLGDTHKGTILSNTDGVMGAIEYIGGQGCFFFFMGDGIEAIVVDDPRFSLAEIDQDSSVPMTQAQAVIDEFKPIKKKCLGWLLGNHEVKLIKFGNLSEYIAKELGVPYGTYTTKLTLDFKHNKTLKFYLAHGWGSINSRLPDPMEREHSQRRSLKRLLYLKAGDCNLMAMGHTHKLLVAPPTPELFLIDDRENLKQHYTDDTMNGVYIPPDLRWFVNTGGFYRSYQTGLSSYVEVRGLDPAVLGFATVVIRGGEILEVKRIYV